MLPDDPDKTLPVEAPQPSDLLRDNAGYIFGRMLDDLSPGDEALGDEIGPYTLCELLGEGGFGMVWRAEQSVPVRREVALKVIKPGMHTLHVLDRFNRERQALASLDHPGISRLLDAGVTQDGRPWFAMEMVRGGIISTWCEEHSATLEQRLQLFSQVCEAVQHAHEKGVLHRDLKPANILVTLVDGAPVPKVIDFGMAKAVSPTAGLGEMMMTQADQVLGTPLYMSPEQVNGASEIDARTDVYALGMVLYELLTGALPYDLTAFRSRDLATMRRHILETHPERPSTLVRRRAKGGGKVAPAKKSLLLELPADLDWIALHALEKSRESRYQSTLELAADVQRHLDHQRVLARPPDLRDAAGRWMRRHRRGFLAAAVSSVLSAMVIGGVLLWQRLSAPDNVEKLAAEAGFTNGLGMRFVPVPIIGGPTGGQPVLFCIWETRVQDYKTFATETSRPWTKPLFEQGPDHPAVYIGWHDATAFCQWLTARERRAGRIAPTDAYRLPSDHEWSCAMGIGEQENPMLPPRSKNANIGLGYPWGMAWPPKDNAGNYRSDELLPLLAAGTVKLPKAEAPGRWDGFATTAPVGTYAPSGEGLYDLGGNAWEWCEDWFDGEQQKRVLRGSSWTDLTTYFLRSSCRQAIDPEALNQCHGFRVVLAQASSSPASSTNAAPSAAEKPANAAAERSVAQALTGRK